MRLPCIICSFCVYNQSSQKRNTHALLMKSALYFFAPDFREDPLWS